MTLQYLPDDLLKGDDTVNVDLSILHLVANASALVQLILLLLLLASIISWRIMFQKNKEFHRKTLRLHQAEEIVELADWAKLNEWLLSQREQEGIPFVLRSGLRESMRFAGSTLPAAMQAEHLRQFMQIKLTHQAQELETSVPVLATIGSVSPYVGLFGTVWGIMMAFKALGASTAQATLAMVAPGISEALVATAMGLFAAIPAVVGYNRFQYQVGLITERYEVLVSQFCHLYARYLEDRSGSEE